MFAAVMITCNGIVGASVLVAALRQHTAAFNAEGTEGGIHLVLFAAFLFLAVNP